MTKRQITNVAGSVRQRLLNMAKQTDRPFNDLVQYCADERWLYRLSQSQHGERCVLKGVLILDQLAIRTNGPEKPSLIGVIGFAWATNSRTERPVEHRCRRSECK